MSVSEILLTIVNIIIEAFCVSYFLTISFRFLDKNNDKILDKKLFLKFLLFNLCSATIIRVLHICVPSLTWLKPILLMALFSISAWFNYKTKIYKSIIATVLFLITAAIVEVLSVLILNPLGFNSFAIANNICYNSLFASALSLIEALIAFTILQISSIFNKSLASVENKLKYFIPQLIAIIVCLFPSMILLVVNYYKYSALFIFINLLQLLVVSFVGIYNLRFVVKHENTEMELANTITYNETLKKVNEGVRGFKHDMGNIVQSILGYIAINDAEGAKNYCQNLVIGFNDINVLSILSPKVIDDPAIYGVVVNKILVARDKNMTLSLDVNLNVSEINFPKFDLSRMLGILIDNAIEAGEQTEAKKLIVHMRHDFERNKDIIIISNSIKDTNIDINNIFKKNYSTKSTPSGFGLYEVNKFLKQNPQACLVTTIDKDDYMFTQTLTIDSNIESIIKESTVA